MEYWIFFDMFQRQHWMVLAELRNIFHSVVTNVFNGTAHSAMFSILQGAPLQLPIDMFIFKLNSKRTICSFSYFYCAHLFFPFANSISFLPLNRNWCPLWSSFMDLFGEVKKREVHPLWSYLQSRNHVKKLQFSLNRSEKCHENSIYEFTISHKILHHTFSGNQHLLWRYYVKSLINLGTD